MTLLHFVIVSERFMARCDFCLDSYGSTPTIIRDLIEFAELVLAGSNGLVEIVNGDEFLRMNSGSCSILGLPFLRGEIRSSSSECWLC